MTYCNDNRNNLIRLKVRLLKLNAIAKLNWETLVNAIYRASNIFQKNNHYNFSDRIRIYVLSSTFRFETYVNAQTLSADVNKY